MKKRSKGDDREAEALIESDICKAHENPLWYKCFTTIKLPKYLDGLFSFIFVLQHPWN